MRLELRAKGVRLSPELHEFIDHKLHLALGPLAERLYSVRVRLTDENGPRNGEDIRAHVLARLLSGGSLASEHQSTDSFSAVAGAIERIGRRVTRHNERTRTLQRSA